MTTFVLLLTVWTTETPEVHVYESDLTGKQCIELLVELSDSNAPYIASCEVDYGYQPSEFGH